MFREKLLSGAADLKIELTSTQVDQFILYMDLLREWNEKVNLTAITDPEEIVVKHFLDSLLLLPYVKSSEIKLVDVGTGAGFPGIPLKILLPNLGVNLVDSLGKRVKFLQEVITQLDLSNINAIHSRAEDLGRHKSFRGAFDVVTARAVSRLNVLCEYCLPLLKVGGVFIAAKGPAALDEVKEAKGAIDILGGIVSAVHQTALPFSGDIRNIVLINKVKTTPAEFPRKAGTPEKKPLIGA